MEKTDNSVEKLIVLMEQYKNLIFSICIRLTGDYFAAEDIAQETFISAYEHLKDFDGRDEKAWLCRIASNKCIDYLKSAKRREISTLMEDEPPALSDRISDSGPAEAYMAKEVIEKTANCCDRLPPPYDGIARSHFILGMTAKEISLQSGKPVKTVQTQIYRARSMLRKLIGEEGLLG